MGLQLFLLGTEEHIMVPCKTPMQLDMCEVLELYNSETN